jgi:putative ABC transport system substrate-binding protein
MQLDLLKRREFITLLGGTAIVAPRRAQAQRESGVRRIGWLVDRDENDAAVQASKAALRGALAKVGWIEGRNLRIDTRFGARDPTRIHDVAAELVSLAPEVIVTNGGVTTRQLQRLTRTIPIVFTAGPEPVDAGLVKNIAQPEGNTTGFPTFEPSISGKWLELLKAAMPALARASIVITPESNDQGASYVDAAASTLGIQAIRTPVRNSVDTVRAIDAFATEPNGGLVVMPPPPNLAIRETIAQLAAQYRLPSISGYREQAVGGALMSYGRIFGDEFRGVASYVDRLLRGGKVSELPVQFPTKYELVVNLNTAKAIGLDVPASVLARADEVIE